MRGVEFGSLAARVGEFDGTEVPKLSVVRALVRDLFAEVEKLEYALGAAKLTPLQFGPDGLVHPIELTAEPVISLRDHFAGLAMAAIIAEPQWGTDTKSLHQLLSGVPSAADSVAIAAFKIADAMLAERAKAGG